ncbi:hypothetical protein JOC78_002360 [Bacillus ectoiniformans]|uniref:hypothetical protein n=1 Tax=Bacillus ectoiniformans TaxID=1494429 RepID=UPI001956FFD2|nr:hypothetical protein [Bacillus ectoiniformans]MBM7649407.1 hypothetical protein [Bacillus ectoiniformans]
MKSHGNMKELIYVHLNTAHQYTVSYGVEFHEFVRSLPRELNHLVLLKHGYNESEFNMHTRFEYVDSEDISKLLKEDIAEYGSFCWIDFEDTDGLNELDGQEIAELLYLGHSKDHLRRPFYSKLNNRFVYLSQDDEWFNKTYYRNTSDFYHMLGRAISLKLGHFRSERSFFGLKKGLPLPPIPKEIMASFTDKMKEGMVFSLSKAAQNRASVEIPVWVIGDFSNMDEMFEEYMTTYRSMPDGHLVFDKRTHEWSVYFNK